MDHQFQLPGSYKKWTYGLIAIGVVALLYGFIMFNPLAHPVHGSENVDSTRFWAVLLQNSVFFLGPAGAFEQKVTVLNFPLSYFFCYTSSMKYVPFGITCLKGNGEI